MLDKEPVKTITVHHNRSNSDVEMVEYKSGSEMKFIPNDIFETFPNVMYIIVIQTSLEVLKPEFFKNAHNLEVIKITNNLIFELTGNLFVETPKLEYLNLGHNNIKKIDSDAFKGLKNLKGLYLEGNKIINVNIKTFSGLPKLTILDLLGNTCINKQFLINSGNFFDIEFELAQSCDIDSLNNIKNQMMQISSDLKKFFDN